MLPPSLDLRLLKTDCRGPYLESKGNTAVHVRQTIGRASALFSGYRFNFPLEADAGKAAEWLNSIRRNRVPVELPEGDAFTPGAVAKLLGISGSAVRAAVLRLDPSAVGESPQIAACSGRSPRVESSEGVLARNGEPLHPCSQGVFRWLVKAKRLGSNPFEALSLVNSATDVRRARRELNANELRRLFDAAKANKTVYRGLSGQDRYMLYLTAAGTGYRANALANLTPSDFDLAETIVTLPARFNKSRKLKVQPLPPDVADALHDYLCDKPAGSPVWGEPWAREHRGAEMLRIDLKAAGIPYSVEGPDGPEYADFHSLRHSYLTLGGRSGIDLRTLQVLARHSKPELTARYTHRHLHDLAGAVAKLPNLVPMGPQQKNVSENLYSRRAPLMPLGLRSIRT